MASIKELFTREECNKTQRVTIGSEWIDCLGTDSDAFRKAKLEANRLVVAGDLALDDFEPFLIASLIVDWSFDEECNNDNKVALLREAPSLCEAIDRQASKRANFTKRLSPNSTNTQKAGSGSAKSKTQKTKTP